MSKSSVITLRMKYNPLMTLILAIIFALFTELFIGWYLYSVIQSIFIVISSKETVQGITLGSLPITAFWLSRKNIRVVF